MVGKEFGILIVDDEEAILNLFRIWFGRSNIVNFLLESSSKKVLANMPEADLYILDENVDRVGDGAEMAHVARSTNTACKVMSISGNPLADLKWKPDYYVGKPLFKPSFEEIIQIIDSLKVIDQR